VPVASAAAPRLSTSGGSSPRARWPKPIRVEDAADYPDVARYIAQGFLERGAVYVTSNPVVVSSERPSPDRVIFRFEFGGAVK
jgi:hypothetical protein